jgi:hypothetical protein
LNTKHLEEATRLGYLFACSFCKYHSIGEESYHNHMAKKHDQPWPENYRYGLVFLGGPGESRETFGGVVKSDVG